MVNVKTETSGPSHPGPFHSTGIPTEQVPGLKGTAPGSRSTCAGGALIISSSYWPYWRLPAAHSVFENMLELQGSHGAEHHSTEQPLVKYTGILGCTNNLVSLYHNHLCYNFVLSPFVS